MPGSKRGSLDRLCAEFLTSRSIPPKSFAAEVRAIFRLQVDLGWRHCADEAIRSPRDSEMSKRLCKALNLGAITQAVCKKDRWVYLSLVLGFADQYFGWRNFFPPHRARCSACLGGYL